jgi:ribosomal protein S12 methylthiotransferase accessory factor
MKLQEPCSSPFSVILERSLLQLGNPMSSPTFVREPDHLLHHRVRALHSGRVGLSSHPITLFGDHDDIPVNVQTYALPPGANQTSRAETENARGAAPLIYGTGASMSKQAASVPALAELLERYSAWATQEDAIVFGTEREFAGRCLPFADLPRCSEQELANPACPIRTADSNWPIRWVDSVCLTSGRNSYVPACMVYSSLRGRSEAERFVLPSSTGCAAQTSMELAVYAGLCEVIERDALSVSWLQMLSLPQLSEVDVPPDVTPEWRAHRYSSTALEYRFFNATNDCGAPTILGVQFAPSDMRACVNMSCSTSHSFAAALGKARRDLAVSSIGIRSFESRPDTPAACNTSWDGALYMAQPHMQESFDFLSAAGRRVSFAQLESSEEDARLPALLQRLANGGHHVYAVDLTTEEALSIGMRVVKVLVPTLQPLSFSYRARFLAHSRLYSAPFLMGHPARLEASINPLPIPFA